MKTENANDGGEEVGTHMNIELGLDTAAVLQVHVGDRDREPAAAWDLKDWAAKAEADLLSSRRKGAGCLRRGATRSEQQDKGEDSGQNGSC